MSQGRAARRDAASSVAPIAFAIGTPASLPRTTHRTPATGVIMRRAPELPLTGGCLCGGVRFEVTEPLVSAGYCHCTRCQRRTGSAAAVSARVAPGSLRVTSGQQLIASFDPPDGWKKAFCSACGGALWAQNPDDPVVVAVRM